MIDIEPTCDRCGLCCSSYTFWMSNRSFDDDPKGIKRLMNLHAIEPVRNKEGELGACIPIRCKAMIFDGEHWACGIYKNRPVVCKEYFCERMIKKALANGVCL